MKTKIEFHEKKSRNIRGSYIETQIYVENVEEFLKLCAEEEWGGSFSIGSDFAYNMKHIKKSRAKRPKFDLSIRQKKIMVYPKENLVTGIECRLHYVCQHSFDMFPQKIRQQFYDYTLSKRKIGFLYTLKGEKFEVFNTDIIDGFMLRSEQERKFGSNFVNWIKHRRKEEEEDKNLEDDEGYDSWNRKEDWRWTDTEEDEENEG